MADKRSRIVRLGWVGLVRCFPSHTLFVTKTVSGVAQTSCRHNNTSIACDVTHTGRGWDHPTQPTHPNQTDRQREARLGMTRQNIRTVVSAREQRIAGDRAVPFGPIRMWGSAAHDSASVRGRK